MHRTPHPATLVLLVLLLAAVAPPSTPTARADGDPLEEYDFSGKVPPSGYLQQSYTHAYRYGLWTIQHYTTLDPFEGSYWALGSNTFERVNVYYGTRPLWHSDTTHRVRFEILRPKGERRRGAFRRIVDTRTDDCEDRGDAQLKLGDVTGRGGITLRVSSWNGAANGGSSAELIHLSGDSPATAKVEELWYGSYEKIKDLDGDGRPEIMDSDRVHEYASYLPHKGLWWSVVLVWDPKAERYVLDADGSRRRDPEQPAPTPEERAAGAARFAAGVKEDIASRRAKSESYDWVHIEVMITLARGIQHLLWSGQVEEARRLLEAVDLPYYGPSYEEGRMDKASWWRAFVAGSRKSKYWKDLVAAFPALRELE
ncbi:MAG: hypothetical protein QNJ98_15105 [Planctomycetota bacterium]|nr:hypothetical protein [Planctomycetota bacterium]